MLAQQPPDNSADALSGYLRTLAGDPRNSAALLGAGRAALEIGDPNAAVGFYARAAESSPRSGAAKAGLGAALVQLQQPQRALSLFAEAANLGLAEADFAADRGLAYDLTGDNRRAQHDYATALKARHDDETARRYALSLGITGDRAQALALLDPLIRRRDPAAWRARAFILALNGNVADADAIAKAMLPSQAEALHPFLVRLASLTPAQKAAAVTFGDMPSGPGTQVAAASTPVAQPVTTSAPVRTATSTARNRRSRPTAPDVDTDASVTRVATAAVSTSPAASIVAPVRASVMPSAQPSAPTPAPTQVATAAPVKMQTVQALPSTTPPGSAASLNGGALQAARDQLARIAAAKAAANAPAPIQTASVPTQPALPTTTPPVAVPLQVASTAAVGPPNSPTPVPVQSALQTLPPLQASVASATPAPAQVAAAMSSPAPIPQAAPTPGPIVTASLGSSPRETGGPASTSLGGAGVPLPPPVSVALPPSSVSAPDVAPQESAAAATEAPRGPVGPPAPEREAAARPAPIVRETAREPARRSIPVIGAPKPILAEKGKTTTELRARPGSRSATAKAAVEEDLIPIDSGRKSARRVAGNASDKADDAPATTSSTKSARASARKGEQLAQSETASSARKSATRSGKRAVTETSEDVASGATEDDASAPPAKTAPSKKSGRSNGSKGEQLAQADSSPSKKSGGRGASAKADAVTGDAASQDSREPPDPSASGNKKKSSSSEKSKSKSAAATDDSDAGTSSKSSKKKATEESGGGSRVYVQVAGGANRDDLDKAWAGVKKKAPDLMKGKAPSTTPLRFTNRLLVGPFKDEDEAQSFVNKMAGKGLSGFTFKSAKGQKVDKIDGGK